MRSTVEERFWPKVNKTISCWLWTAKKSRGYGHLRVGNTFRSAHRISYEWSKGPIPDGLQIDHLCQVRACVNPAHLEAVTARTNLFRSDTPAARNAAKTHCPQNHPYDDINGYKWGGLRYCKTCRKHRAARWYQQQKLP